MMSSKGIPYVRLFFQLPNISQGVILVFRHRPFESLGWWFTLFLKQKYHGSPNLRKINLFYHESKRSNLAPDNGPFVPLLKSLKIK